MTQKATQIPRNLQTIKFQINSALESEKKQLAFPTPQQQAKKLGTATYLPQTKSTFSTAPLPLFS